MILVKKIINMMFDDILDRKKCILGYTIVIIT